jgi:hypothetical protein
MKKAFAGLRVLDFTTTSWEVTPGCGVKTGSRLLSPILCPAPLAKVMSRRSRNCGDRIAYELTHPSRERPC